MENVHIHLFPAVGSLKEKRMCFAFDAAPHNTAAQEAATAAEGLNEATADLAAGETARAKIDIAQTKVTQLAAAVGLADAADRPQMLATLDAIKPRVQQAKEMFDRKMTAIVARNAATAVTSINTNPAAVPNVDTPFITGLDQVRKVTPPNAALLSSYAQALRDIRNAQVAKNPAPPAAPIYPGVAAVGTEALPAAVTDLVAKRQEAMDEDKKERETAGYIRKAGVLKTNDIVASYRNGLIAERTRATNDLATAADGAANLDAKAKAADRLKSATDLLAALETAEAARLGTAPTTGPSTGPGTTPAEVPAALRTDYEAVIAAKDKPEFQAKLDALNAKISNPTDRVNVANALAKQMPGYAVSITIDTAGAQKISVIKSGTTASVEVEQQDLLKRIVEMILRFVGALPPERATEMAGLGTLDVAKIDGKIAELTALRTTLNPTTDAAKITEITNTITYLTEARKIVVECAKLRPPVSVSVDATTGKLTFSGDNAMVARLQALYRSMGVSFRPSGSAGFEIDRIDPRTLQILLRALQQLAVANRPGIGAGFVAPSYPGSYAWNGAGAGFDQGGNPYAMVGQGAFVNKPVADYGSSNRTSRA